MNFMRFSLPFLAVGVAFSTTLQAQVVQELTPHCRVDWTAQRIMAVAGAPAVGEDAPGRVRVRAFSELRTAAFRNLWQGLGRLPFDGERLLEELWREQPSWKEALYAAARAFTIEKVWPLRGDSLWMQISLPLPQLLADAPLRPMPPPKRLASGARCPICGQPWPTGRRVPPGVHLLPAEGDTASTAVEVSGLVVTIAAADFHPALLPRIVDENGKEVYSRAFVDESVLREQGLVLYAEQTGFEAIRRRAGAHALRVKALGSRGATGAEIIISNHDALHLHAVDQVAGFLHRGKVVIWVQKTR